MHASLDSKVEDIQNCKSLLEAVQRNIDLCKSKKSCVQIFTHGPKSLKRHADFTNLTREPDLTVDFLYIHSPYGASAIFDNPKRFTKYIRDQFEVADSLRAEGVVIHFSKRELSVYIKAFRELEPILKNYKSKLILEIPAVNADLHGTYETPEKLNAFCNAMNSFNIKYGICVDTSHLWRSGVDISTKEKAKDWFSQLQYPNRIELIHFNSNLRENFGKGDDLHQIPLSKNCGIWKDIADRKGMKETGLMFICEWAKKKSVPLLFEFNRGKKEDVVNLVNLMLKIS